MNSASASASGSSGHFDPDSDAPTSPKNRGAESVGGILKGPNGETYEREGSTRGWGLGKEPGESRMTAAADSEERGQGVTLFARNAVVLSDGNPGSPMNTTLGRNGRRKTSYLGWAFDYNPAEVGILAPTEFELPRRGDERLTTCPICRGTFLPRRSDHLYCSDGCRRKGGRQGGREKMETRSDAFMRRCQAPGCGKSLAGRTARAKFCPGSRCRKAAYYWKDRRVPT